MYSSFCKGGRTNFSKQRTTYDPSYRKSFPHDFISVHNRYSVTNDLHIKEYKTEGELGEKILVAQLSYFFLLVFIHVTLIL